MRRVVVSLVGAVKSAADGGEMDYRGPARTEWRTAMPPAPATEAKPTTSLAARVWRDHLRPLLILGLCLFAFRWSVLDWNVVPTGSMKPTIVEGDYILVNKLAYDARLPFTHWSLLHLGEP